MIVYLSPLPEWEIRNHCGGIAIQKEDREMFVSNPLTFLKDFPEKYTKLTAEQTLDRLSQLLGGNHPRVVVHGMSPSGSCANFIGRDENGRFMGCPIGALCASLCPEMEIFMEHTSASGSVSSLSFRPMLPEIFSVPITFLEELQGTHDDSGKSNFEGDSKTAVSSLRRLLWNLKLGGGKVQLHPHSKLLWSWDKENTELRAWDFNVVPHNFDFDPVEA